MNNSNKKNKHLTQEEREKIFELLLDGCTVSEIGRHLNKHKSTISKEIKTHRVEHRLNPGTNAICANLKVCNHKNLCSIPGCRDKQCRTCEICRTVCPDFEFNICKRLLRAPYVCDGCKTKYNCRKPIKYYYKPSLAQKEYEYKLVNSRTGINITETELERLDNLISPLIRDNSQSLNHIFATHEEEIGLSKSTIYNYIDDNILSCSNIDMPRRVKFKKRKKSTHKKKINKTKLRQNRTYDDYIEYITANPDANVIEMDTVEGVKGESLLLTLHCVQTHFQIAHLISNKESTHLKQVFELYYERFNDKELFKRLFHVILTDNGCEFSDVTYLEELGLKVFFCDPNRSDQKGACEKNHEFIRYYIPKGKSFAHLKQRHIWLMMSHINSVKRKSLNNKSPYEVMEFIWGKEVLQALHIKKIEPDEVILNNSIFRK